jgi:hypothetical protein
MSKAVTLDQILALAIMRSDWKRVEQRQTTETIIHGRMYTLEGTGRGVAKPVRADPAAVAGMSDKERYNTFETDYNYVGRLFPDKSIGFDLDELMEALYGAVVAGGADKKRRKKKTTKTTQPQTSTGSPTEQEDDDDTIPEEMALPDVVYNKRLKPTAEFMGLPPSVITPQTTEARFNRDLIQVSEMQDVASAVQAEGGGGGGALGEEEDVRKAEGVRISNTLLRRRQRRLAGHTRMLPLQFLPYFLYSQRPSVLQVNSVFTLCYDLMRNMERHVMGYRDDQLYRYTLLQLRVNFDRILANVQKRALGLEGLMDINANLTRELGRLRLLVHRMSATVGRIVDLETTTGEEIEKAILEHLVHPLLAPVTAAIQQSAEDAVARAIERQLKQAVERSVKQMTEKVTYKLQLPDVPFASAPPQSPAQSTLKEHKTVVRGSRTGTGLPLSPARPDVEPKAADLKRPREEASPSPFAAIFKTSSSEEVSEPAAKRARLQHQQPQGAAPQLTPSSVLPVPTAPAANLFDLLYQGGGGALKQ